MNLYVIRDLTAEVDSPVFEAMNDGVALRQYARLAKDNEFASEFELYMLGEHDCELGLISAEEVAMRVVVAMSNVDEDESVLAVGEVVVNE